MAEEVNPIGIETGISIHQFPPSLAIGSVSPAGTTVGGPAFTLTVNGSGFTAGSTVLWSGAPRATTFVGTTQLTAAILATDIAAVGSASITVSNPSPAATSGAVPFAIIPNITDIMSALGSAAGQTPAQAGALTNLRTYLTNQDATTSNLQSQLSTSQSQVGTLTSQNAALSNQIAQQNAQITKLQASLAASQPQSGAQSASPLEVAQSLKGVLDQVQNSARSNPGVQTTLTNLNVQVKALLNVQRSDPSSPAEAMLVFPDPTALPDPNTLSTVSLSFGAIPNLQSTGPAQPDGSAGTSSSSASSSSSSSSVSSTAPSSSSARPPSSRPRPASSSSSASAANPSKSFEARSADYRESGSSEAKPPWWRFWA
ncbi:MAG: hypothetical protein WB615_00365 [Candidatus Tumulicola sp.]